MPSGSQASTPNARLGRAFFHKLSVNRHESITQISANIYNKYIARFAISQSDYMPIICLCDGAVIEDRVVGVWTVGR
jgi:hypothetical protein